MRTPKKSRDIYAYLLRGIETGKFRIGERIPPERDLAEQFRVSRPTITAAIHRLVKENMIRRNHKAGSMVTSAPPRKSMTFGAILLGLSRQHQEETIFSAVASEILLRAGMEHSMVLLQDPSWFEYPHDPGLAERYKAVISQFIERQVAGVFLTPQWILPDQEVSATAVRIEQLRKASIPVVLIDSDIVRYPARSSLDLVGIDNFHSGYILAEHFLKLGCRRIDFFAIDMRHPTQEARIAGYLKAMESYGLPADTAGIHYGDLLEGDFVVETLRQRRPEAVLIVNDFRAASVMRLALAAGIRIPRHVRMGSFDDLPMTAHLSVPLTTIRQPSAGIGAVAFHTMLQRIAEPALPPIHIELSGELIVRASSGSPISRKRVKSCSRALPS
ncbi:MAG: LacI family DNA-binding transcriptional regulator [Planctomycetia bacterium]|nr:LacI family DNA-binding transcriptional regulator [Planctomycetia bacterium]